MKLDDVVAGDVIISKRGLHATRSTVLATLEIDGLKYIVRRYLRKTSKAMPHYLVNKPRIDAVKYLKTLDYEKEE